MSVRDVAADAVRVETTVRYGADRGGYVLHVVTEYPATQRIGNYGAGPDAVIDEAARLAKRAVRDLAARGGPPV